MEDPTEETKLQYPIRTERPRPGRGPGGLLCFAGFALVAGGGALVLLPHFVPELAWSIRKLGEAGVTGGPMALVGCLVFALGLVARNQARFHRSLSGPSDADLVLEHVAGELADIRADLGGTNARLVEVKEETRGLFEAVQARETIDPVDHESRDAVFRLAASLDQLGARLDRRLAGHNDTLEGLIRGLHAELAGLQEWLAQALVPAAPAAQTVADMGTQGLGLLDTLEDEVLQQADGAAKTSARGLPAVSLGYSPLADVEMVEHHGEPAAPMPVRGAASIPLPASDEPSAEKMQELRALLSDARVREALQNMQVG
jgi:hypothetical protein